jgi:hypothetical protein
MLQVHKLGNNEEGFENGKDDENRVAKRTGIHKEHEYEFQSRDTNQDEKRLPDPASIWLRNFSGR